MNPSPWPEIPPITASDLRTYVNKNRDHALALLQSAATSAGNGPVDRHLGTLRDPRSRDSGAGFDRQREHGNQTDDAALIEEADAHTAPSRDGAQSQKSPLEVSVPTGQQEGHGHEGGQAEPQLYEQSDNQIATSPYEGKDGGDLVSHTVQEDTSGTIDLDTEEQALQAPQDGVNDRIPISQIEAQTQDLYTNKTVPSEMMGVLTQNEEEAILVEPVTQIESVSVMMETVQALAQKLQDVKYNASIRSIRDDYRTERHGSQGDDELSADDIDTDEEFLLPEDIVRESGDGQVQYVPVESDGMPDASDRTASESELDSIEETEGNEPTPDTSVSDTFDVWRRGLAESGSPENLKNTGPAGPGVAEAPQALPAEVGTTTSCRHPRRSCEVRVKILIAEIASEVKLLTNIKLKQCLEREIKSTKVCRAQIDRCKLVPSREIRIWTSDDRGAQLLRQVYGWMPGEFGGLQIQRKNSTVVVPKI
ncbi:MAG: hypothetical protein Q9215_006536 [Flavoplaca cf. flavocitrina]